MKYHEESLKIHFAIDKIKGIAYSYSNIGFVYFNENFKNHDLNIAHKYHEKSLKIRLEIGDIDGIANSCVNIGSTLFALKQYELALTNIFKSYAIYKQLNALSEVSDTKTYLNARRQELGKDKFIKYANTAIEELEPEYKKEIDLSDFLNEPHISNKKYGRNDRVKVKYSDGTIVENKYKKLIIDIENGKCEVIE